MAAERTVNPLQRVAERAVGRFWLRGCDAVGEGAHLDGRPFIDNAGRLEVGARLHLSSRPVQSHLVVARGGALAIGDDVWIAHGAAIAAHARVTIGAGTRIGAYAVLSDTDFHAIGSREARPTATALTLGRGVRLGSRVTVLRGAAIGDGARVASGSVVSGEVPAGAVVAGVPAVPVLPGRELWADGAGVPERVARVVAAALGLRSVPAGRSGPADVPEWDSLGSLRVALALEDAFGLTLDDRALALAQTIDELARAVEQASVRRRAG